MKYKAYDSEGNTLRNETVEYFNDNRPFSHVYNTAKIVINKDSSAKNMRLVAEALKSLGE